MNTTTADRKILPGGAETAASTNTLRNVTELGGRVLLSVLFLASGLGKIGSYAATAGYMAAVGVPSALLPVVIATEVLGALAIIAGWHRDRAPRRSPCTDPHLRAALEASEYLEKVRNDFTGGVRSGVNGTPTFFVNGARYEGSPDVATMGEALDRAVRFGVKS